MLSLIDSAVAGAVPFLPVKLVTFPEFAHCAPVFPTVKELKEKLAIEIPNEHTERLIAKAKEHDIFIQSGSFIEYDPKYPNHVFNTTCLISKNGILSKYRKVNPWIPYEVHSSPHDIEGYTEELFSRRRNRDRKHRLRDLLRLAFSRIFAAIGDERRGNSRARVGVYGPLERDRADGLVDDN